MCFSLFSESLLISSDEVGALVFDIGSYTVRAGYAGEDCPKVRTAIRITKIGKNCLCKIKFKQKLKAKMTVDTRNPTNPHESR